MCVGHRVLSFQNLGSLSGGQILALTSLSLPHFHTRVQYYLGVHQAFTQWHPQAVLGCSFKLRRLSHIATLASRLDSSLALVLCLEFVASGFVIRFDRLSFKVSFPASQILVYPLNKDMIRARTRSLRKLPHPCVMRSK